MSVSARDAMRLWQNIEKIRQAAGLSPHEFCDELELKESQYKRLVSRKRLPITVAMQIAERFHISLDSLVSGKIDYIQIRSCHRGHAMLPERYTVGAQSKVRTTIALLDMAAKVGGPDYRNSVLRKFQVPVKIFDDPEREANIHLVTDVCSHLATQLGMEAIVLAGLGTMHSSYNAGIVRFLSQFTNLGEAGAACIELLAEKFDRNHQYAQIGLKNGVATVTSKCRPDVSEAIRAKTFGSKEICLYRSGTLGAMSALFGMPLAPARKVACIHQGDSECRFEIDVGSTRRLH